MSNRFNKSLQEAIDSIDFAKRRSCAREPRPVFIILIVAQLAGGAAMDDLDRIN